MTPPPSPEIVQLSAAIGERFAGITDRLLAVGRQDIRVVAVSKTFSAETILAAALAGIGDVGESYAQEFAAKRLEFDGLLAAMEPPETGLSGTGLSGTGLSEIAMPQPVWHFIGGLQRNKVRKIAHLVDLWHSVDRPSLATEIAKHSPGAKVLLQVDISGEDTKKGCPPAEVEALMTVAVDAGLSVTGLMGIALRAEPEDARTGFRLLRDLADSFDLDEVSMGMSADLEIAAEEGATIIRVGSALFGNRV